MLKACNLHKRGQIKLFNQLTSHFCAESFEENAAMRWLLKLLYVFTFASGQANFPRRSSSSKVSWNDDLLITLMQGCNTSTTDLGCNVTPPAAHIFNTSVQIPGEVFANVTEDSVGLLYSLYLTSFLFPVDPDLWGRGFTVSSPVVSATVSGRNISNLASPVVITLPITSVEVTELIWCMQCDSSF